MECLGAQSFVSALYDGERVPADVAEHIEGCADCRRRLAEYAEMGAELRVMASLAEPNLPRPAWLNSFSPRWRFLKLRILTARVLVPRFALGLGLVVILALSLRVGLVKAQSRSLWFQFQLLPAEEPGQMPPRVVKQGYREPWCWFSGKNYIACGMVSVMAIEHGNVQLAIRFRRYAERPDMEQVEKDLGNPGGDEYAYVPGQTLKIPVEGGGELALYGQVFDQEPKLAWGFPLNPGIDQMILTHPVLLQEKNVLFGPAGTGGIISTDYAFFINVPREGFFTLALQPFEGAVKGEAEWGEIHFTIDGQKYFLLSGSPITGGDQPHTIWVSRDMIHLQSDKPAFIRSGKLPGTPQ